MTGDQLEALSFATQDYLQAQEAETRAAQVKQLARDQIVALLSQAGQREAEVAGVAIKVTTRLNQTLPLKLVLSRFPEAANLVQEKAVLMLSVRRKGDG